MRSKRPDLTPMASINVTPFVDVALTLLVIFMVVAPALHQSLNVQLPKTKTQGVDASGKWIVTVTNQGQVSLNGRPLSLDELKQRMQAVAQTNSSAQVFLLGDHRSNYGTVMKVMDTIKQSGIEKVGMVTEQDKNAR
jgi:biopolymer transport protein TolR